MRLDKHFDAIVIGAGVAGSAAAYQLSKTRRVLLLEQFAFLHDRGSSHGSSRIFRHAYGDLRYVEMCLAADDAWRALERDADDRLLYRTGGLDIGRAKSSELAKIEGALIGAGSPAERLSAAEANRRFPAFRLASDMSALFQPEAGLLNANRCLSAMQRSAGLRGAMLLDRAPLERLEARADHVTAHTPLGTFSADSLVITAGPWLSRVLADLKLPLKVEQQQVLYLKVEDLPRYSIGSFPIFIHRDTYVYGLPIYERPNCIKVSDHAGGKEIDLEERPTGMMQERAASTIERARSFLRGVSDEIADFQLCLYTKTPDEHFIIDRHPSHANIVIAGGFSGHGFKFGPLIGVLIARLVDHDEPGHDLSLFEIDRFGGKGG